MRIQIKMHSVTVCAIIDDHTVVLRVVQVELLHQPLASYHSCMSMTSSPSVEIER
jgi:hypothetical protein